MDRLYAQGNTYINLPADQLLAFLCHPTVDRAELTPLEDRIIAGGEV